MAHRLEPECWRREHERKNKAFRLEAAMRTFTGPVARFDPVAAQADKKL
jgi:hypothetical protein